MFPKQEFREGFNLAGDDAVFRVVREHVLEPMRKALLAAGLGDRTDYLLNRLFGGDRGDMNVVEQLRRQQFAAQIAAPIAIGMLGAYESFDPLAPAPAAERKLRTRSSTAAPTPTTWWWRTSTRRPRSSGRRASTCARWSSRSISPRSIAPCAASFSRCCRRWARWSGATAPTCCCCRAGPRGCRRCATACRRAASLPPHRIVPLHQFRVGQWYPFRDYRATIADPKTTASVGAMLCLLGDGQLQNFNFRSDELQPQSTARFFGKLDRNNRLLAEDEFYDDLDLDDPDYELPETTFDFRGPMPLGFRQLPVDWWPRTRLYSLDYASQELAAKLNAKTPLKVRLKRNTREAKDIIDALVIAGIEDRDGRSVPNNNLRLRLQTIDNQQGYWLDTGILLDK